MAMLLPPPQYDHPPQIPVIEHVLPYDEVERICTKHDRVLPFPYIHEACALVTRDGAGRITRCEIWLVEPNKRFLFRGEWKVASDDFLAKSRRHERGHCTGWPKDHPGGYYERVLR